jgi:hypothetical protein
MGLLDDAIREHLELKRRRGADATEVAREEHEALGPVRREAEPPQPEPGAEPAVDEAASAEEPGPPEDPAPPDDADDAAPDADDGAPGDPPAPEPDTQRTAVFDADEAGPPAEAGQATEEWGFEDEEEEPEPEEPEEDVLEETPEFLSETPEHDRLWFEQKPPRDFDFDG